MASPATPVRLPSETWRTLAEDHAARADALTAAHRERRSRGEKHAVEDFLFEYYGVKPSILRRWHPGADVALGPGPDGPAPHAQWRWYATGAPDGARSGTDDSSVRLDLGAFLADRGDIVRYVHGLLAATASRAAFSRCFGLHEWAMLHRQPEHRHPLPLRLGQAGTDAVVESHRIRCSHYDAFRFFTPDAAPLNTVQPTRANQAELEQPGCLHANMDLLKWCLKLGPLVRGDLLLDCFELARDIRRLDMQASPYDVSTYGEPAVAIETPEGKAEYVRRQRGFAERTAPLRDRLVTVCAGVLEEHGATA